MRRFLNFLTETATEVTVFTILLFCVVFCSSVHGAIKPWKRSMILLGSNDGSMFDLSLNQAEDGLRALGHDPERITSMWKFESAIQNSSECFLYVAGKGEPDGVKVGFHTLTPDELGKILSRSCAISYVILSSCYSGRFIDNLYLTKGLIIMTSTGFVTEPVGCNGGFQSRAFDDCVLDAMKDWRVFTWADLYLNVGICVYRKENQYGWTHSYPNIWYGLPPETELRWRR